MAEEGAVGLGANDYLACFSHCYRQADGKSRDMAIRTLTRLGPSTDLRTIIGLLDGSIEWATDDADNE